MAILSTLGWTARLVFYHLPLQAWHYLARMLTPKTKFSDLPPKCVQLIFDHLEVQHLAQVVWQVNRQWLEHQRENFRQRKGLILVQGKSEHLISVAPFNAAFIDHGIDYDGNPVAHKSIQQKKALYCTESDMDSLVVDRIVDIFPNLTRLTVTTSNLHSENIGAIIDLFTRYRANLTSLEFYFDTPDVPSLDQPLCDWITNLANQLNSFPALTALTLGNDGPGHQAKEVVLTGSMDFLLRLKRLFISYMCVRFCNQLLEYQKAGLLSQLELLYIPPFEFFFDENPLRQYLVYPGAYNCFPAGTYAEFSSLRTVGYSFQYRDTNDSPPPPLAQIVRPLSAELPKLVHLKLSFETCHLATSLQLDITTSAVSPPPPPAQLATLKALDMEFHFEPEELEIDGPPERMDIFSRTTIATLTNLFPRLRSVLVSQAMHGSKEEEEKYSQFWIKFRSEAERFLAELKQAYGGPADSTFAFYRKEVGY